MSASEPVGVGGPGGWVCEGSWRQLTRMFAVCGGGFGGGGAASVAGAAAAAGAAGALVLAVLALVEEEVQLELADGQVKAIQAQMRSMEEE